MFWSTNIALRLARTCWSFIFKLNKMFSLHHAFHWRIHDFTDGGGGRRQPIIWPKFPDNYMKMKEIEWGGAHPRRSLLIRQCKTSYRFQWRIGVGGGVKFSTKIVPNNRLAPPPLGWCPLPGKSWIHHWQGLLLSNNFWICHWIWIWLYCSVPTILYAWIYYFDP